MLVDESKNIHIRCMSDTCLHRSCHLKVAEDVSDVGVELSRHIHAHVT